MNCHVLRSCYIITAESSVHALNYCSCIVSCHHTYARWSCSCAPRSVTNNFDRVYTRFSPLLLQTNKLIRTLLLATTHLFFKSLSNFWNHHFQTCLSCFDVCLGPRLSYVRACDLAKRPSYLSYIPLDTQFYHSHFEPLCVIDSYTQDPKQYWFGRSAFEDYVLFCLHFLTTRIKIHSSMAYIVIYFYGVCC